MQPRLWLGPVLLVLCSLPACVPPTVHLVECALGGDELVEPGTCAPFLEVQVAKEGDLVRVWGHMYDLRNVDDIRRKGSVLGGRVEVEETGRRVNVASDGAFAIDSLRLDETLRFSALGHRDLYRTVGPLYEWARR